MRRRILRARPPLSTEGRRERLKQFCWERGRRIESTPRRRSGGGDEILRNDSRLRLRRIGLQSAPILAEIGPRLTKVGRPWQRLVEVGQETCGNDCEHISGSEFRVHNLRAPRRYQGGPQKRWRQARTKANGGEGVWRAWRAGCRGRRLQAHLHQHFSVDLKEEPVGSAGVSSGSSSWRVGESPGGAAEVGRGSFAPGRGLGFGTKLGIALALRWLLSWSFSPFAHSS